MSRKDTCRPRRRQPAWVFIQGAALLLLTILSLGLKVASGQAASLKVGPVITPFTWIARQAGA